LDTRFVIAQLINHFDAKPVAFAPTGIHAHEDSSPVAGFGATGSRLNPKVGVAGILWAAKDGAEFELFKSGAKALQFILKLTGEGFVLLRKFEHSLNIAQGLLEVLVWLQYAANGLELANYLLGFFRIAPEIGS
jgi:hypothetical protein